MSEIDWDKPIETKWGEPVVRLLCNDLGNLPLAVFTVRGSDGEEKLVTTRADCLRNVPPSRDEVLEARLKELLETGWPRVDYPLGTKFREALLDLLKQWDEEDGR